MPLEPTLHESFAMGQRVKIKDGVLPVGSLQYGIVTGIAFQHVVFGYIITLDQAVYEPTRKEWHSTVALIGSLLDKVNAPLSREIAGHGDDSGCDLPNCAACFYTIGVEP